MTTLRPSRATFGETLRLLKVTAGEHIVDPALRILLPVEANVDLKLRLATRLLSANRESAVSSRLPCLAKNGSGLGLRLIHVLIGVVAHEIPPVAFVPSTSLLKGTLVWVPAVLSVVTVHLSVSRLLIVTFGVTIWPMEIGVVVSVGVGTGGLPLASL